MKRRKRPHINKKTHDSNMENGLVGGIDEKGLVLTPLEAMILRETHPKERK